MFSVKCETIANKRLTKTSFHMCLDRYGNIMKSMNEKRRKYNLAITLNTRCFNLVVIDTHYEKKHPEITDQLILELVGELDGSNIELVDESGGFKYFAHEMHWQCKPYRIVLTYCEEDFLGVINVFRVKEKKL